VPGEGTTFTLSFPALPADEDKKQASGTR